MQTALYHCITKLTFKADCLLFLFVCFQLGVPCHVLAAEGYCLSLGFPSNSAFGKKKQENIQMQDNCGSAKTFPQGEDAFLPPWLPPAVSNWWDQAALARFSESCNGKQLSPSQDCSRHLHNSSVIFFWSVSLLSFPIPMC